MRTLLPILLLLPATALAQDPPGAGDVVIAELMSKPGDGPEWFEVLNVANGALTLQGCVIGDESTATHEIAGEVVIQPGERALVAKGEMPDGCPPADYQYGSPALNDGGDTLTLSCPPDTEGDPVASLSYGNDQQAAPREGRSLFVCEESLEGDALEVREGFDPGCGGWMATPGAENEACPAPPPYPLAGQVVVNEVAVRAGSAETPEWVELKGTAAGEFNLDGCAFLDTKKDGSDGDRLDLRDRLTIQGGQRIVLASKDFPEGCDVIGVFDLGRVDIPTTYSVTVRLECPGADGSPVVVDSLDVDWKGLSDTDTLQRDPGDSGNVCLAPADAATCEATGGTPGAANGACPPPPPPPAP